MIQVAETEGAQSNHAGCEEVQLPADFLYAKQHDAEEARLQKEGRQDLICHQGPNHRTGLFRKDRPIRSELVRHDQTRNHTHPEGDREDLEPVTVKVGIEATTGLKPERLKHHQKTRQPDREGRKDEVE